MYNRWMPPEYSTELYHHGVKGMKWGVRKEYKQGSLVGNRRGLQRELNRTDKQTGRDRYHYSELRKKYQKAETRGASAKKLYKIDKKAKAYEDSMKRGYAKTQKLLQDVSKSGYKVEKKATTRAYMTGKDVVRTLAFVPVAALTGFGAYFYTDIGGIKYKVKE